MAYFTVSNFFCSVKHVMILSMHATNFEKLAGVIHFTWCCLTWQISCDKLIDLFLTSSFQVYADREKILRATRSIMKVDLAVARAKHGMWLAGSQATFSPLKGSKDGWSVCLQNARHPALLQLCLPELSVPLVSPTWSLENRANYYGL